MEQHLEAWMLHEDLVLKAMGTSAAADLVSQLPAEGTPFAATLRRHLLEEALTEYVVSRDVQNLNVLRLAGRLRDGDIVWLEQAFYFKSLDRKDASGLTRFHATSNVMSDLSVEGTFRRSWIPHDTGHERLSGRSSVYVVGYVESCEADVVRLRPILIGARFAAVESETHRPHLHDLARMSPSKISTFARVEFDVTKNRVMPREVRLLAQLPVGGAAVRLIEVAGATGDVFADGIWVCDLNVKGELRRAGFLTGAGDRGAHLRVADVEARIRALDDASVDVLVLQHDGRVPAAVVNLLQAHAAGSRDQRQYVVIDGEDTVRILRHFEHGG